MKQASTAPAVSAVRRLVAFAAGAALLLSISGCRGGASSASPTAETPAAPGAFTGTPSQTRARSEQRIAFLEARAAADPLDVFSLNELAIEHLQRARETGDVSALSRASTALEQSFERQPSDNYEALALSASLAVTQHDFAHGLALAEQAITLKPKAAYAYGARGDAQMGLGRYDEDAAS